MANLTYFINLPNDATANVTEGSSTGWPVSSGIISLDTKSYTSPLSPLISCDYTGDDTSLEQADRRCHSKLLG